MTPTAISTRDAGLALISRLNRWLLAGAVTLTGAISLVAARSFHGHTVSAASTTSQSASSPGAALQQPSQAPTPSVSSSAPVVSGGS